LKNQKRLRTRSKISYLPEIKGFSQ